MANVSDARSPSSPCATAFVTLKIKTRYGAAQPGRLRIRVRARRGTHCRRKRRSADSATRARLARAVIEMVIADKMIGAILDMTDRASRASGCRRFRRRSKEAAA